MTGIVHGIHRPSEVMQLRARPSTLLQLSLQPIKNDRTSNRPSHMA
jgi:hypothetical protein